MMKPIVLAIAFLVSIPASGSASAAQEGMPAMPKPTKEHKWLKKFVGHWDSESAGAAGEGQPVIKTKGTIKSRMMGDFWVVNTIEATVSGMPYKAVQTIGYDVEKKKYVGTWIDSMAGFMWHYTGVVEKNGTKLVLEATGPDMMVPGKTSQYRDAYEFKSDNEVIATSSMLGPDGKWVTHMTGSSTRTRPDSKMPGHTTKPVTMNLWPNKPPGPASQSTKPEADLTKDTDKLIAGRRIIKLGNVSTPQLSVYQPPADKANGAAVVICPGGGHHILAMDLEGTEVAEWLISIGVTAIVVKYRVPARDRSKTWEEAVQDAQRAMSIVRSKAKEWNIDPNRIGMCGFSAGGQTAALTALFPDRQYEPVDDIDKTPYRPDFAMLIYPAYLVAKGETELRKDVTVTKNTPPMFFAHAFDDPVTVHSSLALATELKKHEVPTALHVYPTGGHGYGMRATDEPVTRWPVPAAEWMKRMGFLSGK